MNYRTLGKLTVSEIGFGTWGLGGDQKGSLAYGATDDATSHAALQEALDLGITFFDTADLYGYGKSETLLAFLPRDRCIIASKVGFLDQGGAQDFSRTHIQKAFDASCKRLKTDYIDLYQLHSPPAQSLLNNPTPLECLEALKKEGAIRAIGVATRSPQEALDLIKAFPQIDTIQINLNAADLRALDCNVLQACREADVGVIARTPFAFGFLAAPEKADWNFSESDHRRRFTTDQIQIWSTYAADFYRRSQAWDASATAAQNALRFILSFPDVATVIPGMLTPIEVRENTSATSLRHFTNNERAQLIQRYQQSVLASGI